MNNKKSKKHKKKNNFIKLIEAKVYSHNINEAKDGLKLMYDVHKKNQNNIKIITKLINLTSKYVKIYKTTEIEIDIKSLIDKGLNIDASNEYLYTAIERLLNNIEYIDNEKELTENRKVYGKPNIWYIGKSRMGTGVIEGR